MSIADSLINEFATTFIGNVHAHGVFIRAEENAAPGEKQKGKAFTKEEDVQLAHYVAHIRGEAGLGIIPIRADSTVSFSVIDLDVYNTEHTPILNCIEKFGLPLLPFRSKSGGLHLYIFYESPIPAKAAILFMNYFRQIFGLAKKTEIYPKQTVLKMDAVGNWINLPYYNAEHTVQYLMDTKGTPQTLAQALLTIRKSKINKKQMHDFVESLPLFDAPPCLQHLYMFGDGSPRNNYLFSLARYFKSKHGDDYAQHVLDANMLLAEPLKSKEVMDTIISSHDKKDYSYLCTEDPIASFCNKEECQRRKFGIGGEEVSALTFEELTRYVSDSPYYEWKVNGATMTFDSEDAIKNQEIFRSQCMRMLDILPQRMKNPQWDKVVNRALKNIIKIKVDIVDDISPGATFNRLLCEYLTHGVYAETKQQILMDRVYKDLDMQAYIFKPAKFIDFLQQKQFKLFNQTQIQTRLRKLGGVPNKYYIDKEKGAIRIWTMPFESLAVFVDKPLDDVKVSYTEEYKDEQY